MYGVLIGVVAAGNLARYRIIEHTSSVFQGANDEKKMSIKTIFDTCTPRPEVLTGELKEQQFAASLTKVLRGAADAVYGDAETFFANTYATKGLKSLLHEALGHYDAAHVKASGNGWQFVVRVAGVR